MKPWSRSSKTLIPACALAMIAAAPLAFAQTEGPAATRSALQCMLDIGPDHCGNIFISEAQIRARPWIYPNQRLRFNLGPVQSVSFIGSIDNGHATLASDRMLNPKLTYSIFPMDVFAVKFAHQELTFFIAPPDADGKIRHMRLFNGPPDDLSGGKRLG